MMGLVLDILKSNSFLRKCFFLGGFFRTFRRLPLRGAIIKKKLRDVLQERKGATFLQVLNNFELYRTIFSGSILIYLGLSLSILACLWLYKAISGYFRQYLAISGSLLLHLFLSWCILVYLGLSGLYLSNSVYLSQSQSI